MGAGCDPHFCVGQTPFVLPLGQQLVMKGMSAAVGAFCCPSSRIPPWIGHPQTDPNAAPGWNSLFQGDAAEPSLPWLSGKGNCQDEGVLSFSGGEAFRNGDYCAGNKRDCFHSYSGSIRKLLLGITGNQRVCPPGGPWILDINCAFENNLKKTEMLLFTNLKFSGKQECVTESKVKDAQFCS